MRKTSAVSVVIRDKDFKLQEERFRLDIRIKHFNNKGGEAPAQVVHSCGGCPVMGDI